MVEVHQYLDVALMRASPQRALTVLRPYFGQRACKMCAVACIGGRSAVSFLNTLPGSTRYRVRTYALKPVASTLHADRRPAALCPEKGSGE